MRLSDLKKSVSEMSMEELLALIVEIRNSRRSRRAEASTRKAKTDPTETLLAKLSPEQRAMLAKMLAGGKK